LPLPPDCPLRSAEGVRAVLLVCTPNLNPKKPDALPSLDVAKDLLKKSYLNMLNGFYKLAT